MLNQDPPKLDDVFAALANSKRRQIFHALSLQPLSINQLASRYSLSLPAIHRHIKALEVARLVQRKKSGRVNFLALDRRGLDALRTWSAQYHTYWGSNHETLDNYVASLAQESNKQHP